MQEDEQSTDQMPRRASKDADRTNRSPFGPVRSTGVLPVPGVPGVGTAGGTTGVGVVPDPGSVPGSGVLPLPGVGPAAGGVVAGASDR